MDNNRTFIYANKLSEFVELAEHAVKCVDPEDTLSKNIHTPHHYPLLY